jgi:hypothetical protein
MGGHKPLGLLILTLEPLFEEESMITCQRCKGTLREIVIITDSGERCESFICFKCGECVDEIILENRTREKRAYWRRAIQVELEETKPSPLEKILRKYELEAIRFSF